MNAKIDDLAKLTQNYYEELRIEKKELKAKLAIAKRKLDDLEDRSRRKNLVVVGISERDKERWEDTEELFGREIKHKLGIELKEEDIEMANRKGGAAEDKQRPIIVNYAKFKTREKGL